MVLHRLIKAVPLGFWERLERFALKDFKRTHNLITHGSPDILDKISEKKALEIFKDAASKVPAYKKFLRKHGISLSKIRTIHDFDAKVPETNKKNYIKPFSYEERCRYGSFPHDGNIDESSGSTGKPTNWIRSIKEESALFRAAAFEFNYCFDIKNKNYIVLSAWSNGPWATGIKFCELTQQFALVKSTDTNISNIISTLKLFGPKYNYLIAGYPPFLKKMVDEGSGKIRWKDYKIDLLTGGEGNIIEWDYYMRDKLGKNCKIVSSYGCSDIDIGIGFETDFSFFIRQLCHNNRSLREDMFGHPDKLPMLFQYNPLMHYIRQKAKPHEKGEHIFEYEITLLDRNVASPKIKYNLHDEGGVVAFRDMMAHLARHEPKFHREYMEKFSSNILRLPFLYIVDRSDGTISLDGANIYPHQIERCIHRNKLLLRTVHNFKISLDYDRNKNSKFDVLLELKKGVNASSLIKSTAKKTILKNLQELNSDYKESYTHNKSLAPNIILFKYEEGPFHPRHKGIKNKYIHH